MIVLGKPLRFLFCVKKSLNRLFIYDLVTNLEFNLCWPEQDGWLPDFAQNLPLFRGHTGEQNVSIATNNRDRPGCLDNDFRSVECIRDELLTSFDIRARIRRGHIFEVGRPQAQEFRLDKQLC